MCGIVGFTGDHQAAPVLLAGLSKLEYRGYDSAGLAVRDGSAPTTVIKAKGRLKVLAEKTNDGTAVPGTCGIGHTRWATPVSYTHLVWLGSSVLSAEQIYARLGAEKLPYAPEQLLRIYTWDDHRPWRKAAVDGEGLRKKWERIRAHSGSWAGGVGGHNAGEEAGDGIDLLKPLHPGGRYDYHRFLRQFATLQEEQELDLESFDPVQYQFGMEHYGNIPLIEPLEYREVHRLSELVIAIDTSGSCDVETVTQFLQETYAILSDQENFFRKMKVYLIQCDCCIEQVQVIHSREEWEKYSRSIAVHGRGGTDFTPVFRYVEELRRKKELSNLRAMIYFTDGDGIYPRIAQDYETAFVFVKRTEGMHQVPKWARVFCTADN